MTTIHPFLWFDSQAEEAAKFYTSIFPDGKMHAVTTYPEGSPGKAGTVMTVEFSLAGMHFTALNGGSLYHINSSISFFVSLSTREEIDRVWSKLSDGGTVMMPLQQWPFSEYYGWIADRYGVSWQFFLEDRKEKIAPCIMFSGSRTGQAKEAIEMYESIFPDAKTELLALYEKGEAQTKGVVKHARFTLCGQQFVAMDSGVEHDIPFTPALSFVVGCKNQEETDRYWSALTNGGKEIQCGWLEDRFGISWQIVPNDVPKYVGGEDPEGAARAMQAMLSMKKLDINTLKKAYEG